MTTTEIILSKANSIRFADKNGLKRTFDNTLSYEEVLFIDPVPVFSHKFFLNDTVLVQIKSGLAAKPVLTKYVEFGSSAIITETDTTIYPTFMIYDYVLTLAAYERFYLQAVGDDGIIHKSECVEVIAPDEMYLLFEWSNNYKITNDFEFDYNTPSSIANVNFMRLKGEMIKYKLSGSITVYDNQREKERLNSNVYRNLTLETDIVPTTISEVLGIAMQHDMFLVNEVGYVAEELPEIEMIGSQAQMSVLLTTKLSLGFNTPDIGFTCDDTTSAMIENKLFEDAVGNDSASVTEGYGLTQIVLKALVGPVPSIKVGYTIGGDEILNTIPVTVGNPIIINTRFTPDFNSAWTIYFEVTGGTMHAAFQTMEFNPQP